MQVFREIRTVKFDDYFRSSTTNDGDLYRLVKTDSGFLALQSLRTKEMIVLDLPKEDKEEG